MRRTLVVVACLVAVLGTLAPAAFAQAPAPKVTINGLFDQITSTGRNLYDGDFTRSNDSEWYARTRFRPDFTFEVGRVKAVMGLEIDLQYGSPVARAGLLGASLNTDVRGDAAGGAIEMKWFYTEFDLTGKGGLLPFIPVTTVARVGGQPFGTLGNYKPVYANGDFAGISAVTTFAPNLRTALTFVNVEEEVAISERSGTIPLAPGLGTARATSGDDFAFMFSPEITPFKGLDIKPLYSWFHAEGVTNGNARRTVFYESNGRLLSSNGNVAITGSGATPFGAIGAAGLTVPGGSQGTSVPGAAGVLGAAAAYQQTQLHEERHTIGFDMRWRMGPFSFMPTFYYQFGDKEQFVRGSKREADIRAWIVDLMGGWQLGPLLLEGRYVYTSGNKAQDDLSSKVKYFEPLDLDTGYWAGWASIFALGVDYYNGGGGTVGFMSTNIGYDRYGRHGFGVRATYAITPALSVYGTVNPTWTAEKVDTDALTIGARRVPVSVILAGTGIASDPSGDDRYLGTEVNIGTTWRFAPNTAFDMSYAYLFAGAALDAPNVGKTRATLGTASPRIVKDDAEDAWLLAARLRMSF
jgi:hypothetical protein